MLVKQDQNVLAQNDHRTNDVDDDCGNTRNPNDQHGQRREPEVLILWFGKDQVEAKEHSSEKCQGRDCNDCF